MSRPTPNSQTPPPHPIPHPHRTPDTAAALTVPDTHLISPPAPLLLSPFSRRRSIGAPEMAARRVVIGVDGETCGYLDAAEVKNCVVDAFTAELFPAAARPRTGIELLKFQWTAEALLHGHEVLYVDADVIFRGRPGPQDGVALPDDMAAAASDPLIFFRAARRAKGPGVPDLQMMSDHSPNLDDAEDPSYCDLRLMEPTFEFLAASSTAPSWRDATYERAFRMPSAPLPENVHVEVDHAGLVCARGALWSPGGSGGCLSMALWFATPANAAVVELFRGALATLRAMPADSPPGMDQIAFNRMLPSFLSRLKLVVLDVRVAGNEFDQRCARKAIEGRPVPPPPMLLTHFRGPTKTLHMRRGGVTVWRMTPDSDMRFGIPAGGGA